MISGVFGGVAMAFLCGAVSKQVSQLAEMANNQLVFLYGDSNPVHLL